MVRWWFIAGKSFWFLYKVSRYIYRAFTALVRYVLALRKYYLYSRTTSLQWKYIKQTFFNFLNSFNYHDAATPNKQKNLSFEWPPTHWLYWYSTGNLSSNNSPRLGGNTRCHTWLSLQNDQVSTRSLQALPCKSANIPATILPEPSNEKIIVWIIKAIVASSIHTVMSFVLRRVGFVDSDSEWYLAGAEAGVDLEDNRHVEVLDGNNIFRVTWRLGSGTSLRQER